MVSRGQAFDIFGIALFAIAIIAFLIEALLLLYLFLSADSVDCNWIFCTFSKGYTHIEELQTVNITKITTCTMNGVPVNCSELDLE